MSTYRFITVVRVVALSAAGILFSTSDIVAEEWKFSVAPYLWFAGLNGTVSTLPGLPTAEADLSFSDILENLDLSIMAVASATKGKNGIFTDLIYVKTTTPASTPGPIITSAELQSKSVSLTLAGERVVSDTVNSELRVMGGVRYWNVENDLSVTAGALPPQTISTGDNWLDVVVGVRGTRDIGARTYLTGTALLGAGGSELTFDLFGGVGYRFNEGTAGVLGYRHLSVDRRDGTFVYDVTQSGLIAGVVFSF